jgi:HK97 family phage prohead protease
MKIPTMNALATTLSVRAENLPDGVCGVVTGIALRYNVEDSWGTRFLPGSVDKTRAKVVARKVKLFDNHGARDYYGTRTHIGTVTSLVTAGDAEVMTAELFDTEEGRKAKEYLSAVMRSGAESGLSIGFHPRGGDWSPKGDNKYGIYDYSEIELEEISLAPRQAVPGAEVTSVRRQPSAEDVNGVRLLLRGLRTTYGSEQLLALLRDEDATAPAGDEPSDQANRSDGPAITPAKSDADDESADARSDHATPEQLAEVVRTLLTL